MKSRTLLMLAGGAIAGLLLYATARVQRRGEERRNDADDLVRWNGDGGAQPAGRRHGLRSQV
jgi:hypothetical protein